MSLKQEQVAEAKGRRKVKGFVIVFNRRDAG